MEQKINWSRIYKSTGLTEDEIDELNLDQEVLVDIYYDFAKIKDSLNSLAIYFVNQALGFPKVHSARYRIKDSEHLIAKIVRKKHDYPDRIIDASNYREEIKDLVGIRILHLFKRDYKVIDKRIRRNFKISDSEKPTIYLREGDDKSTFDDSLFDIKIHPRGYRSMHYIIESTPTKHTVFIEIQVRTIFEEGWSEIDHKLLYPEHLNDILLNQFTMVLNGLAGTADSMSSLMVELQEQLDEIQTDHKFELSKKDKKIKELEDKINRSNLSKEDKSDVLRAIEGLPKPNALTVSEFLKRFHDTNTTLRRFGLNIDTDNLGINK